jgi:NADPH-dependent curcumin reductase CurA
LEEKNRQFRLKQRPYGKVDKNTWAFEEHPLEELHDSEFRIKNKYISIDPAMRSWMDDRRSYIPAVKVGDVMRAAAIGQVVESKNENYKEGDWLVNWGGVQEYPVSNGRGEFNLGQSLMLDPSKFLSVLGLTGFSAYFGLLDVGKPKEGETIVVSAAAGAVGSIVGQIAKLKGLKVIGIAGGTEKCDHVVNDLGFDACIDYKSDSFPVDMIEATADGVDIYFDSVGGDMLDFMLTRINKYARVVICGAISQYNNIGETKGPSYYLSLLVNSASMQGFVVMDYKERYTEAFMQLSQWMGEGKIVSFEHIEKGIEKFPELFDKLFSGQKRGKLIMEV